MFLRIYTFFCTSNKLVFTIFFKKLCFDNSCLCAQFLRHATYFICCKVSLICETFRVKWTCFCTVCNAWITKHFEEFSSKWWNVKTSIVLNIRFQIRGNRFRCTMKSPFTSVCWRTRLPISRIFFFNLQNS